MQSIMFALLAAVQQRKVKWYHDNDREPQEQNITCLPRLQFSRTGQKYLHRTVCGSVNNTSESVLSWLSSRPKTGSRSATS